jgi:hypothetical protein
MLFVVNCLFFLFSALRATGRIVSARATRVAIAMKIGKCGGFDNKKISVIEVLQPVDFMQVAFSRYFQMNLSGRRAEFSGAFAVIFWDCEHYRQWDKTGGAGRGLPAPPVLPH